MSKFVIYEFPVSSCSWRLRIAFGYKGVEYESREVDDLDTPEFRKMNPAGHVPVLEVDEQYIAESLAILEYLEEVHPEKPLLPQDPFQRAKVREICELIASGIQPLQHPLVAARYSDDPKKQAEWTSYYINKGFRALEQILEKTSRDKIHCVRGSLTLADCCLVPQVYNAIERFNVDVTPYPTIMKIYTELMKLPFVNAGRPDNFPSE
jgi:maleylacetoacetate isomerase